MSLLSRLTHIEETVEARKPQPLRILAIPPGCVDPVWMTVDELIASGADFQWKTKGNDLDEAARVLDYLAPGSVIE